MPIRKSCEAIGYCESKGARAASSSLVSFLSFFLLDQNCVNCCVQSIVSLVATFHYFYLSIARLSVEELYSAIGSALLHPGLLFSIVPLM